jgi:hypothetical protein
VIFEFIREGPEIIDISPPLSLSHSERFPAGIAARKAIFERLQASRRCSWAGEDGSDVQDIDEASLSLPQLGVSPRKTWPIQRHRADPLWNQSKPFGKLPKLVKGKRGTLGFGHDSTPYVSAKKDRR